MRLSPDSARSRLRAGVAAAHDQVDAGFSRFDLTRRDDYRRFLEIQAAVLLPWESALTDAGAGRLLPDWPRRLRGPALTADLADLGGRARPEPGPAPLNGDPAFLLGALYTLEGSRLGARLLQRRAAASADPAVRSAGRFLGAGERGLWAAFLLVLEASPDVQARPEAALDGALRVFRNFAAALDPGGQANVSGAPDWRPGGAVA